MNRTMQCNIIVGYDKNRVIGKNNMLPWHLPEDMAHFKETTIGNTVVMGRKTWESLRNSRRPLWYLPGRKNLIITSTPDELAGLFWSHVPMADGPEVWFISFEQACRMLSIAKTSDESQDWYIIGGEQIYAEFLKAGVVDKVIASEVDGEYEGDAFFQPLGPEWKAVSNRRKNGFNIVEYTK